MEKKLLKAVIINVTIAAVVTTAVYITYTRLKNSNSGSSGWMMAPDFILLGIVFLMPPAITIISALITKIKTKGGMQSVVVSVIITILAEVIFFSLLRVYALMKIVTIKNELNTEVEIYKHREEMYKQRQDTNSENGYE
ncbi:hypothetical protein COX24_00320 [bacterium (Candidatus Gribaldobacteria) CG23_combo_of_CG06-09_8_20_14_all_37_87_8]|uniref:Uncharacterized protein n=2 Tax=Bacteria candidate phyla TaxID=1783234 RepID=A0A2H0X7U6_UNCKA|nr:MAG: hypothetical protein COX24_00320 [bacterium (Candidatus Gribaldobacteria) CG23_combo_of_CG06-09_8_20_14_all_37_87_8]PIS20996.1 MAG: hypothetical protein COT52_00820 [candidate division WWE3 bacterium CG08_land_8_20_14_0_20_43_13]